MDKEKTNSTATEQKRAPGTPWLEEVSNKLTPIAEAMDEAQDLNKGLIVIALDGDEATVAAAGGREALGNAVKIVLTAREPFNQYLPIAARMIAEDVKEAGTPILTIPLAPEDEDQDEDHPVAPAFVICDCEDEDEDETEDEVEPNNTDSDHE